MHEWNILRRHLTTGQKAMFADEWREDEGRKALERKKANGGDKRADVEMFPHPIEDAGKARDKIGEKVGISGKSVDKARTIKETVPEVAKQVLAGEVTLEAGYKEVWMRDAKQKCKLPRCRDTKQPKAKRFLPTFFMLNRKTRNPQKWQ